MVGFSLRVTRGIAVRISTFRIVDRGIVVVLQPDLTRSASDVSVADVGPLLAPTRARNRMTTMNGTSAAIFGIE